MNTLGGIDIGDLVMDPRPDGVRAAVQFAADGTPLIWEDFQGGRSIDLTGERDTAWLTFETLMALRDLARIPGAVYELFYEGETYNVRFRHEDAPSIQATPVIARPKYTAGDVFHSVSIKLMEV